MPAQYIFEIKNNNYVWFFNEGNYYIKETGYNKNTSLKIEHIKLEDIEEEINKVKNIAVKTISVI
jgi:hypothetical protein